MAVMPFQKVGNKLFTDPPTNFPMLDAPGNYAWCLTNQIVECRGTTEIPSHPIKAGAVVAIREDLSIPVCYYCTSCVKAIVGWYIPKPEEFTYDDGKIAPTEKEKPMGKKKAPELCLVCGQAVCEVCVQCETVGCAAIRLYVTRPEHKTKYPHLFVRTQKARGFLALRDAKFTVPTPAMVVGEEADITTGVLAQFQEKVFVRPCPVRPRHGFVESRSVPLTVSAVGQVFQEARKEDSQAELLLLPFIKSAYNAVVTPTRIAIGSGHDGATAGRGAITIPLMGEPFGGVDEALYQRSGVDLAKDDPYFEVVFPDKGGAFFTQLRAGVKIPPSVGKDFIPYRVRVQTVLEASNDLLEWERQVKTITRGTVVCHVGGTLISHYGVHCLYNNVPIMTSRRPKVGEWLIEAGKAPKPDPDSVIRGLSVGAERPMTSKSAGYGGAPANIGAMLVALHNAGVMTEDDGFWIGYGAAIMMRVGMAASHGEARHKSNSGLSRGQVYEMAFKDYTASRATLGQAWWMFTDLAWSGGYGGKKWANCTEALVGLDSAILRLLQGGDVTNLVNALNNAVNQAHNNGWWLNKFVGKQVFDAAAAQNLNNLVEVMPVLYEAAHYQPTGAVIEALKMAEPVVPTKVDMAKLKATAKSGGVGIPGHCPKGHAGPIGVVCAYCIKEHGITSSKFAYAKKSWGAPPPNDGENVNLNGHWIKPGTKIVAAQGKIHHELIHIQYKVEGLAGYFSENLKPLGSIIPGDLVDGENLHSWCEGSSDETYFTLDVTAEPNVDHWTLTNKNLGVVLSFKLPTLTEAQFNEQEEQAAKAAEEAALHPPTIEEDDSDEDPEPDTDEGDDDDSPF